MSAMSTHTTVCLKTMKVFVASASFQLGENLASALSNLPGVNLVGLAEDLGRVWADVTDLQPDLVMLDVHLLGSRGMALVKAVAREDKTPFAMVLSNDVFHDAANDEITKAGPDFLLYDSTSVERALSVMGALLQRSH